MNYIFLKEWCNKKLDVIKEDLVRSVNIPENAISYSGKIGSYIINPFGANSYSFDVMLDNQKALNQFIKDFSKEDIFKEINDETTTVKSNDVNNYYVVSGFINKALLQDLQVVLETILNRYIIEREEVTKLGDMK